MHYTIRKNQGKKTISEITYFQFKANTRILATKSLSIIVHNVHDFRSYSQFEHDLQLTNPPSISQYYMHKSEYGLLWLGFLSCW